MNLTKDLNSETTSESKFSIKINGDIHVHD